METFNNPERTLQEELTRDRKYWKRNHLWTLLVLAAVLLWSLLSGPGQSVVPGAQELTLTTHSGQRIVIPYEDITEAELMEEPQYGTMLQGKDSRGGKSGSWEHPQWGEYTLCVYGSCPSAVRVLAGDGCYVMNLASQSDTEQLYQLIQERAFAAK